MVLIFSIIVILIQISTFLSCNAIMKYAYKEPTLQTCCTLHNIKCLCHEENYYKNLYNLPEFLSECKKIDNCRMKESGERASGFSNQYRFKYNINLL